jgi:lipopolysaccharide/colanic/teichoic acid biosynthesis glycosyltransferase
MNRLADLLVSLGLILVTLPLTLPVLFLVWLEDRHRPFYIAPRVGKDGLPFRMFKVRSMVVNADRSGIDSTKSDDPRISAVGAFVRRFKIDELGQLINVLRGEMSLVGPRPQVRRDVDLYTAEEKRLMSVRPGITDLASIVFSDEGEILAGAKDPDLRYHQVIRPWKSRLALFCIDHQGLWLYLKLALLTAVAIASRDRALRGVVSILKKLGADQALIRVAGRTEDLLPTPPPGAHSVVQSRQVSR